MYYMKYNFSIWSKFLDGERLTEIKHCNTGGGEYQLVAYDLLHDYCHTFAQDEPVQLQVPIVV